MERPLETIEQAVREQPASVVLGAFGVGLGLGVAVGSLLAERTSERRRLATSLGSRMLDSLGEYVPHSIQQHFRK